MELLRPDTGLRDVPVSESLLGGSRQKPHPSGLLRAPATSLPQLLTRTLTARVGWKSEADVCAGRAPRLIS